MFLAFCVLLPLLVVPVDAQYIVGDAFGGQAPITDDIDTKAGERIFHHRWQSRSNDSENGPLGPLYNADSCSACHPGFGRGHPPREDGEDPSFVLQLSIPPATAAQRLALALDKIDHIASLRYGSQLQDKAIAGYVAEGRVRVTYRDKPSMLDDGDVVMLRRPIYAIENAGKGPLPVNLLISPRIAQPLFASGAIASVPEAQIRLFADPNDEDGDGISGRINLVRDISSGELTPGRFGWKAAHPSIMQQTAAAFAHDIGISSPLFPQTAEPCVEGHKKCRATTSGASNNIEGPEISIDDLEAVAGFIGRFAHDAGISSTTKLGDARAGKDLFTQIGCPACHKPSFQLNERDKAGKTHRRKLELYSDLLLHDMGAGLADHRVVARASGWEWRTQPLLGLDRVKSRTSMSLLHDGRARTITEAILWHGGEARAARSKFAALDNTERQRLIAFLKSL